MVANLENSAVKGLEKVSFHSNPKERQCQRMLKLWHNALISHASKVMLKILQARLQRYMNHELPDVQAGFRKGRGTRDQMPASTGSWKKQESSRKTSTSVLLTTPKPLTLWITTNCGKFFKRSECQATCPDSWEICMQVTKQVRTGHGTTDCFQIGKEYVKAVYCHPAYLTSMQSTYREMLGWMKHKLESRLSGEISITSYMQITPPLWQKVKKN